MESEVEFPELPEVKVQVPTSNVRKLEVEVQLVEVASCRSRGAVQRSGSDFEPQGGGGITDTQLLPLNGKDSWQVNRRQETQTSSNCGFYTSLGRFITPMKRRRQKRVGIAAQRAS